MDLPPKMEVDLESQTTRYEYDPWLLDDHPLRSHPTECIPGLGPFISESFVSLRKQWKQSLLRAIALVILCLLAFQLIQLSHVWWGKTYLDQQSPV
ncbi:hypothetical protein N7456_001670 [Penicillium angulare]|uniref:Uncharacterized protein n=1 Tax=Penicillium angulare TaxID=116970 RepID=A0A9W9G6V9_9EURO|nr:hypothetical protein N7456_001670 [Penicillium angulare]